MKFEDTAQNLRGRLGIINVLVVILLGHSGRQTLCAPGSQGQVLTQKLPRTSGFGSCRFRRRGGVIFDRDGHMLVDSRPIYEVILSRQDLKGKDKVIFLPLVQPLARDSESMPTSCAIVLNSQIIAGL